MPLADGAEFAGYTIERLLGTGGMGEVYLAQHPRLPKLEALKILPANVSADGQYRQRFAREADLAASLWHPHIVAVHDRGEYDGQLWIAMDYVDGMDAAQLMRNRYPLGMPVKEALTVIAAIAEALDYAHESNLLHRDVKPANILITAPRVGTRRILLADFGIARATGDGGDLTATNMTVGSVAYAPPEQLTGKPLDGRADQYALACTAYHLLTGAPPYGASNPAAIIGSHLSSPVPRPGDERADLRFLDYAIARAMSKEPYQRFTSCKEFADALNTGSEGVGPSSEDTQYAFPVPQQSPSSAPPAPREPTSRDNGSDQIAISKRVVMVAGAIATLLAVGLVAFIGARLGQSDPPPQPTALPSQPSLTYVEPTGVPSRPPRTVTETLPPSTVTQSPPQQRVPPPPAPPPRPAPGDLGLSTAMSHPFCNGQGIVVLGNVTTPGRYREGIQALLAANPGASYLRTDQSCPSLRQATEEGNAIYAVYRPAGMGLAQLCAAVRSAGGDAYGKVLDTTTDPAFIPC